MMVPIDELRFMSHQKIGLAIYCFVLVAIFVGGVAEGQLSTETEILSDKAVVQLLQTKGGGPF